MKTHDIVYFDLNKKGTNGYKRHVHSMTLFGLTLKTSNWILIAIVLLLLAIAAMVILPHRWKDEQISILQRGYKVYAAVGEVSPDPSLTLTEQTNWNSFVRAAYEVAPIYEYPVNVILAQAALESARGTSKFAKERFNYFGIGAFDHNPDMAFTYENQKQVIIEYMRLIKAHYPEAYAQRKNPDLMIEAIKEGGYATDTNYVAKIKGMREWRMK